MGWDMLVKALGGGKFEKVPVNPLLVVDYLVALVESLGGRNFVQELCYDQWESASSVASLQSLGLAAFETTFTNPYKGEMYQNFLEKAQAGRVKMYGMDVDGWVARWQLEMKYLQQDTAGSVAYYHHPSTGPVQTDDMADVVANLVHRMVLRMSPTKESVQQAHRHGTGPQRVRKGLQPTKGPSLWSGGSHLPNLGRLRNR
jgi:hypothetical protein